MQTKTIDRLTNKETSKRLDNDAHRDRVDEFWIADLENKRRKIEMSALVPKDKLARVHGQVPK